MAIAGRKPTAQVVRFITGKRGRKPPEPVTAQPNGRPTPPLKLTGRPAVLWRKWVKPAWWLSAADSQKAFMWVHMAAAYEASVTPGPDGTMPAPMLAAHVANLRNLGSELGFDPGSRARLGGTPPANRDAAEKYFTGS